MFDDPQTVIFTTLEVDPNGFQPVRISSSTEGIHTRERRLVVHRVLSGGVLMDNLGISQGDRIFDIRTLPLSKTVSENLKRIFDANLFVNLFTVDGAYKVAQVIFDRDVASGEADIRLQVQKRLDVETFAI